MTHYTRGMFLVMANRPQANTQDAALGRHRYNQDDISSNVVLTVFSWASKTLIVFWLDRCLSPTGGVLN